MAMFHNIIIFYIPGTIKSDRMLTKSVLVGQGADF